MGFNSGFKGLTASVDHTALHKTNTQYYDSTVYVVM